MKKQLLHIYFSIRNWWPLWFGILNREGRTKFETNKPALTNVQQNMLTTLTKDGVATVHIDELFPDQNMLPILKNYAGSLNPEDAQQGKKSFLKKYWDKHPVFNLSNPFLKLSLNPTILDVVNSYMQMWTKLKYYDLALTIPVPPGSQAVQSQRWHRDPEEKKICKVFIYLNDVDETAGPFIFALGSNKDGEYGSLFPQKTPEGIYPPEGSVEKAIPKENIKMMTAPAGTVIFCDTSGLHKGGYATGKERLMFTAFYSAKTYSEKEWYSFNPDTKAKDISTLSPQAQYAVTHN